VLIATALVLTVEGGNAILLQGLPQQLFAGIESYGLLTLPLFILLGELMGPPAEETLPEEPQPEVIEEPATVNP